MTAPDAAENGDYPQRPLHPFDFSEHDRYPDAASVLVEHLEAFVRAVVADATSDDVVDAVALQAERQAFMEAVASHIGGPT